MPPSEARSHDGPGKPGLSPGEHFFPLFQTAPIALTLTRLRDGAFLDANARWCNLIGYARHDLVGKTPVELGLYPNQASRERVLSEFRKAGFARDQEIVVRRKDGTQITLQSSLDPVAVQGEPCILGYLVDVTPLKLAQEALRASEERLRLSQEQSAIGILTSNESGWTDVNPAFAKLLGYTREEVLQLGWERLTHPDDLRLSHEARRELWSTHDARSYVITKRYLHRDGHTVWAEIHSTPVRDASGKLLQYTSHVMDVTLRETAKQAQREQQVARSLVRRMLREMANQGGNTSTARRELGRALGREANGESIPHLVEAFAIMGIGELRLAQAAGSRYEFIGRGLLEKTSGAGQPTCYLALGYLEACLSALEGIPHLGAETRCESQGHAECQFTIRAR